MTPDSDRKARMIADRALELAEAYLESGRAQIALLATPDARVLRQAAEIVRSRDGRLAGGRPAAGAEHLAFTLIVAAHDLMHSPATAPDPPPAGSPAAARPRRPAVPS